MATEQRFRVHGVVRDAASGMPLAGMRVRAYDKDLLYDDLLGDARTDPSGSFDIRYSGTDFRELFSRRPDIYFRVYDEDDSLVLDNGESVRWHAGTDEQFDLKVPTHHLPPVGGGIQLLDGDGKLREELETGESMMISAQGLAPGTSHAVRILADDGEEIARVSLLADRYGVIAPTAIWPDMGIGDPEEGGPFAFPTFEDAAAALGGRALSIELLADDRVLHRTTSRIAAKLTRPRLYSATSEGAPRRGLLLEQDELTVRGTNLPAGSLIDVYLVARQSDWREGDPIQPIVDPDGREVMATIALGADEREFSTLLWARDRIRPGGYDLVARATAEREYGREERRFRAGDLVSDRFGTSVVVRQDVFRYKPIHQGCVNAVQIAGKRLNGAPYFEFTDNFPVGTDVWATLDPAGLMPQKIGKKIRYYVTQHKDATAWANDPSAVDVNGSDIETVTAASCVNAAEMLVWPNPQTPGKYDLVVDFGNEAPNPANFVSDGTFTPPADMIDGAIRVGFYVTDDPAVAGTFAVGQTTYNDGPVTIPATVVWAPPGYPPTIGSTPTGTLSLPLIADVRYPAIAPGVNTPVSGAKPSYPVVLLMHGMHTTADPSYQGYTYLLDHFASRGYIALSIDVNAINAMDGMQNTRGRAVIEHLTLLRSKNLSPGLLQGKIDLTQVAIMGHSRGGDGVVQAEIYNQALPPAQRFGIKAVVALAPTDFSGPGPNPLVLSTSKFLGVYGANDGDVWGGANPSQSYAGTGFRFYDRATVEKAFVFVPGATHNRFNTQWGTEGKVDASSPKILPPARHQLLLKGYMTAFLQAAIEGRGEQLDYFKGELKLPQASTTEVHASYRPDAAAAPARRTIDDFESSASINQSSLGGAVTFASLDGSPQENTLGALDANSPHQSRGLRLKWGSSSARYESAIPLGTQRDLTPYGFLSFRVGQTVGSPANPAGLLQDLYVRLATAGGGPSRAVRAGFFQTIPFPYKPEYIATFDANEGPNTKSALKTVRIPLHAWAVKALTAPIVDLANVESIAFEFFASGSGELEIDDIEFTG